MGEIPMDSRPDLYAHVRSFLEFLESGKNYSSHTIESYNADLLRFAEFAAGNNARYPEAISKDHLRSFIAHLFDQGYSRKSIARKIASLRSLFKYLKRKHLVESNPAANLATPKLDRKLPAFLDETSMQHILDLPDRSTTEGMRDAAVLEIFYSTGIRLSELINLNVDDIDHQGEVIKVTGKGRKQRIVPVGRKALKAVDEYLESEDRLSGAVARNARNRAVFLARNGKRIYPQMVGSIVKKYISKVSELEKISPHLLRHTFATHLLNRGADLKAVKDLLGHESLSTTQIYTHVTTERLRKVYHQSHPKA